MKNEKILILVPAYRDLELSNTIKSALRNAEEPESLVFGILNQYGEETKEILNLFRGDKRFKIIELSWREARGEGWARGVLEDLYEREEYVLQTDAHMIFGKKWDKIMKDGLKQCNDEKAILSSYPIKFEYNENRETIIETTASRIRVELRPGDGRYNFASNVIEVPDEDKEMKKTLYATGGMEFFRGNVLDEVHYNRDIAFTGSEIVRSAQLYTFGYNVYEPIGLPIYHHYGRFNQHKFWEDMQDDSELREYYDEISETSDAVVDEIMSGKIEKYERYFGKKRPIAEFLKLYEKDKATSRG